MDEGYRESDKLLGKLERRIHKEYKKAVKEMSAKTKDYFGKFKKKDAVMKQKVKSGEISKNDYKQWRANAMATGERWNDMRDVLAQDLQNTSKIARSITNGYLPEAYAINHNYGTYEIEKGYGIDTSYTLYDRPTVERLLKEQPEVLPALTDSMKKKIEEGKALKWRKGQVQSVVMQSVLQGESIPNMSKRIAETLGVKDEKAAVRYARTAMTGAQAAGRVDSYKRAQDMGIELEQEWSATVDMRTRASHIAMDGERQPVDHVFSNGCMFPGDPSGPPEEVYNCRCRLVAALKDYDYKKDHRYMNLPDGMTYDDWKKSKLKPEDKLKTDDKSKTDANAEPTYQQKMAAIQDKVKQNGLTTQYVREAGKLTAAEVNRDIDARKAAYDIAKQNLDDAGQRLIDDMDWDYKLNEAKLINRGLIDASESSFFATPEHAYTYYLEQMNKKREIEESSAYRTALRDFAYAEKALEGNIQENAQKLKNVLSQVREMGSDGIDMTYHLSNKRSPVRKEILWAYDQYPKSWVEASKTAGMMSVKKVNRGYYYHGNSYYPTEIAISGSGDSAKETAVHELGHRFEKTVQGILNQEIEFYEKRTAGEELEWLGFGYRKDEKTRKDDFLSAYMGKEYKWRDKYDAFELVSMGFQYAYADPVRLSKDADMQEWILGLLSIVP